MEALRQAGWREVVVEDLDWQSQVEVLEVNWWEVALTPPPHPQLSPSPASSLPLKDSSTTS